MTHWLLALKGLVIGVTIAMPVGPICMLIIRRSLRQGFVAGAAMGLGAATADGFYGAVAGFGLASISAFLVAEQVPLRLLGGLALILIGLSSFCARSIAPQRGALERSLPAAYLSTFLLTLANPLTIISFAAVFAGLGIGETAGSYRSAAIFVAAIFIGSGLWQLLISAAATLVRARLEPPALSWINRVSGLMLIGFGLFAWKTVLA